MTMFRVEKTKNYTVMSNHHLRNKNLTLKAKGLLSQMLSLPEDWDYTLKGLSLINKESVDAIRAAVRELEREGYVALQRVRNEKGQLKGTEYVIREIPVSNNSESEVPVPENPTPEKPILENPILDKPMPENSEPMSAKPMLENPILDKPTLGNSTQLNKDISNKDVSSTDPPIHQSIDRTDLMDRYQYIDVKETVKKNIGYTAFGITDIDLVDEMVDLISEVISVERDFYTFNGSKTKGDIVKSRLLKINHWHIEYVLHALKSNCKSIKNIRSYILASLFNAPTTCGSFWENKYRCDIAVGGD